MVGLQYQLHKIHELLHLDMCSMDAIHKLHLLGFYIHLLDPLHLMKTYRPMARNLQLRFSCHVVKNHPEQVITELMDRMILGVRNRLGFLHLE